MTVQGGGLVRLWMVKARTIDADMRCRDIEIWRQRHPRTHTSRSNGSEEARSSSVSPRRELQRARRRTYPQPLMVSPPDTLSTCPVM